jgi:hypothetical protein
LLHYFWLPRKRFLLKNIWLCEKKAFAMKCNCKLSLKRVGVANLRNSPLKLRIFEAQPDFLYSYKKKACMIFAKVWFKKSVWYLWSCCIYLLHIFIYFNYFIFCNFFIWVFKEFLLILLGSRTSLCSKCNAGTLKVCLFLENQVLTEILNSGGTPPALKVWLPRKLKYNQTVSMFSFNIWRMKNKFMLMDFSALE